MKRDILDVAGGKESFVIEGTLLLWENLHHRG